MSLSSESCVGNTFLFFRRYPSHLDLEADTLTHRISGSCLILGVVSKGRTDFSWPGWMVSDGAESNHVGPSSCNPKIHGLERCEQLNRKLRGSRIRRAGA